LAVEETTINGGAFICRAQQAVAHHRQPDRVL